MIPERVLLEMAKPIIHHRTPQFQELFSKVRKQLKALFQTQSEVFILPSVGSGAMEAAAVNFFSPGDQVLCVRSGKFGERWAKQLQCFGLKVQNLDVEWGHPVNPQEISKALADNPQIKGVFCQACETSTGVSHPIQQIADIVSKQQDTLFLVDAITFLGVSDLPMDKWGVDVVVGGSQKALMLPPGLSFLGTSAKALKAMEKSQTVRHYFDLKKELKAMETNQTAFTPAVSMINGLCVALDMICEEETLPQLFKRSKRLAKATQEGVKAMGLELFSQSPSDSITAVRSPSNIDSSKVVKHMQDSYNVTIIGGQDHLKGKIFRLGHMGYCGDFDVVTMLSATEMTLKDLGFDITLGKGVSKALEVLHSEQ